VSIAFILTTLVVVVTPGTGVLYTLSAGLSRGWRASIIAAIGCTLGIVPQMIAAITGLAAILNASAIAFESVKYAGVAYLLYLAYKTFRDKTMLEVDVAASFVALAGKLAFAR
jgi:threonine/homoserine/homoserine lactone efflux protein